MEKMTPDEYRRFLMDTPRTGKLATVRADGRPHVVPIWFVLDGDVLVFSCGSGSVKAHNMRRDPRVSLSVDDEKPPYSFVLIDGTAEIQTLTPEEMLPWTTRIARRYMGDALAETYGKRNAVLDELIVRVTPTKVVAQRGIAD
jgi:PPOX class probable F420-dependent enzyme